MRIDGREYRLNQATDPDLHTWCEQAEIGEYTYWYRWVAWKTSVGVRYAERDNLDNWILI